MIHYDLIATAIKHYKKLGYFYIDVPWMVDKDIIDITLPSGKNSLCIDTKNHLVGSAEQSFLDLIINKNLPSGKYIGATPCFRDDIIDNYHQKTFFKVELINYSKYKLLSNHNVELLLKDALQVLKKLTKKQINVVKTFEGFDLEIENVEIGSYGLREYSDFNWVYGTGIAEPRFSKANKF